MSSAVQRGTLPLPDMTLDLPPFRPRFPWWSGDLQTIANRLRRVPTSLAPHTSERLCFPLPDGTGDTLLASLDRPAAPIPGSPLIILIHGLTGAEDSLYLFTLARLLLDRGRRVLRLNLRGAGPSRSLCSQHYYAGRSQDFRTLLSVLPRDLVCLRHPEFCEQGPPNIVLHPDRGWPWLAQPGSRRRRRGEDS